MTNLTKLHYAVEMADGQIHQVTIGNPAHVAFDRTRTMRKWPPAEDAPMLWQTFLAWHAMHYGLKVYPHKFDQFADEDCLALQQTTEDGDAIDLEADPDAVDPTQPDPGSASATS